MADALFAIYSRSVITQSCCVTFRRARPDDLPLGSPLPLSNFKLSDSKAARKC